MKEKKVKIHWRANAKAYPPSQIRRIASSHRITTMPMQACGEEQTVMIACLSACCSNSELETHLLLEKKTLYPSWGGGGKTVTKQMDQKAEASARLPRLQAAITLLRIPAAVMPFLFCQIPRRMLEGPRICTSSQDLGRFKSQGIWVRMGFQIPRSQDISQRMA